MPISKDPEKRKKQVANLKPFPPGVSGNPGGSSRAQKVSALVRDFLARVEKLPTARAKGLTNADRVAIAWIRQMLNGNMKAINPWVERDEGKVPDKVDGTLSGKITVTVKHQT